MRHGTGYAGGAYTFTVGVITNGFHVQAGDGVGRIGVRTGHKTGAVIDIPFVQSILHHRMIFQPGTSAEIDIILLGYEIISRRIQRIGCHVAIPPGKSGLPRPDPGDIFYFRGLIEIGDDIGFDKSPHPIADKEYAPGTMMRKGGFHADR